MEASQATPSAAPESADTQDMDNQEDDDGDRFSLHVKKAYVLTGLHPTLAPLPPAADHDGETAKQRGMNRKRPRDVKINSADKMCLAVMRNEICPYGDKCRFSHDRKAYLSSRPPDIDIPGLECPHFALYGHCCYGLMCRLGSAHLDEEGNNIQKETATEPPRIRNLLSKEVQIQLRKRKYSFKCKRYNERDEKDEEAHIEEVDGGPVDSKGQTPLTSGQPLDYSPLPAKERKLIDFSDKVYVAPLTTVGNLPFRRIMKKFGADITCGEMALASCLLEGKPSEWALLKRHPDEDVFGIQLAAGYPDSFTRAAELLEAHATVDFVDLNLGCPIDLVCKKGCGAALMLRERRLKASLLGITNTLSCPITIKMRTGWDMNKPFAHTMVPKIQSWGIDGIGAFMIHGRSRLQRYSKLADWDYIHQVASSQVVSRPRIPVIGNGDILSYSDYEQHIANAEVEGLSSCAMLARGALIKPWLPTEIKERRHWDISASERLDILKDFVRFGLEHWGSDQQGVNNCRRFLLEWLSFLHRYVPIGMLEIVPQPMNQRPPNFLCGRSDLETLFLSDHASDWIKISEMLLGPVPCGFRFEPKHKANSYNAEG